MSDCTPGEGILSAPKIPAGIEIKNGGSFRLPPRGVVQGSIQQEQGNSRTGPVCPPHVNSSSQNECHAPSLVCSRRLRNSLAAAKLRRGLLEGAAENEVVKPPSAVLWFQFGRDSLNKRRSAP